MAVKPLLFYENVWGKFYEPEMSSFLRLWWEIDMFPYNSSIFKHFSLGALSAPPPGKNTSKKPRSIRDNVENCLCPKWLLCASVSDNLRYRAAVALKKFKYFFFVGKNIFLLIFVGHILRKTTYKIIFFFKKIKKNIFFLFFGKN